MHSARRIVVLFTCIAFIAIIRQDLQTIAQTEPVPTPSSYGTLLETEIRGISSEAIEALQTGSGNGIALPAELNGYPGPRHVLDLANQLELTAEQREQIQALYDAMRPEAIRLGEIILAGEAALEAGFRNDTLTESELEIQLVALGNLQAQLRFVHLRTHLETTDLLAPEQIAQYNVLRGYTQATEQHQHGSH